MTKHQRWTPVIVSNRGGQTEGNTKVRQADDPFRRGPASSALPVPYFDGLSEDMQNFFDLKSQRRADLRFAIDVALALALPAFIGLGVYVAAESIILIAS